MAISFEIWIVEQQNHAFLANWIICKLSSHYLLWLLCSLSIPLLPDSTVPFGRPSASVKNSFILSFCLTITTASLSDPVQNTTPDLVLSQCWCSLTVTHTQPQWVYGMVRVPRDLDCPLLKKRKSLAEIKKRLNWNAIFHLDDERNGELWQWEMNWRH